MDNVHPLTAVAIIAVMVVVADHAIRQERSLLSLLAASLGD